MAENGRAQSHPLPSPPSAHIPKHLAKCWHRCSGYIAYAFTAAYACVTVVLFWQLPSMFFRLSPSPPIVDQTHYTCANYLVAVLKALLVDLHHIPQSLPPMIVVNTNYPVAMHAPLTLTFQSRTVSRLSFMGYSSTSPRIQNFAPNSLPPATVAS